jgi:hypothetical protein
MYIREFEAEIRELQQTQSKANDKKIQRLRKQLARHTNTNHPRFIVGNEFEKVLKMSHYVKKTSGITQKAQELVKLREYNDAMDLVSQFVDKFYYGDPNGAMLTKRSLLGDILISDLIASNTNDAISYPTELKKLLTRLVDEFGYIVKNKHFLSVWSYKALLRIFLDIYKYGLEKHKNPPNAVPIPLDCTSFLYEMVRNDSNNLQMVLDEHLYTKKEIASWMNTCVETLISEYYYDPRGLQKLANFIQGEYFEITPNWNFEIYLSREQRNKEGAIEFIHKHSKTGTTYLLRAVTKNCCTGTDDCYINFETLGIRMLEMILSRPDAIIAEALTAACSKAYCDNTKCIEYLLDRGVDIDANYYDCIFALFRHEDQQKIIEKIKLITSYCKTETLKSLFEKCDGYSCLLWDIYIRKLEKVMEFLIIECGVNPDSKNEDGDGFYKLFIEDGSQSQEVVDLFNRALELSQK